MPAPVTFFAVSPLNERLRQGELILTSNQRLASRISNAYVVDALQRGDGAVRSPRVYSLNNWIKTLWEDLLASAYQAATELTFLESNQELLIWEQVIAESEVGQTLMRPAATAQQAAAAFRLMVEWQLDTSDPAIAAEFELNDDTQTWYAWAQGFATYCQQFAVAADAERPAHVLAAINDGHINKEERITLVGFQDIAPLHNQLLQQLTGDLQHYNSGNDKAEVGLVQCESSDHEIQVAAIWAKQILKQQQNARIAIVIPDLSQQRANVERLLLEVFEPGYKVSSIESLIDDNGGEGNRVRRAPPFNMSAGYALIDAPVIIAAVDLLQLLQTRVELDTLEAILHSPFNHLRENDTERTAQLVYQCRQAKSDTISTARLRQWANQISEQVDNDQADSNEASWVFAETLLKLQSQTRSSHIGKDRSFEEWATFFVEILELLGWPGTRPLDSIEYQQVSHWQKALKQFAGLDVVGVEKISLSRALSQLRAVLSRQIFQPQTADSPLQVLGLLEASGLEFSHLWLTSMSSQSWPPSPAPNPFIPVALQRENAMPHATAQREFDYARQLSEEFIHSAQQVIISAPETVDENPARISSLFSQYKHLEINKLLGRPWQQLLPGQEIRRRYLESQSLESIEVDDAPAVTPDEAIRGGVSIFSDQSACPFRAFAKHRLAAIELGEPEAGLSAAQRGMLLHRALELIWNILQSRQKLVSLADSELLQHCQQASHYAVDQLAAQSPKELGSRFKSIEVQRLSQLLFAWLQIEKTREDFTVLATEQRHQFTIEHLHVNTRIDRIDQLADGSLLIMDYKTGACSTSQWWGDRPEQPQLPLYIRVVEESTGLTVNGISFAQISARDSGFKSAGDEDCSDSLLQWDGKNQTASGQLSWSHQKQHWQAILAALAEDFIKGKAAIDPKFQPQESAKTCQFCKLKPLCRISHQELAI